MLYVNDPAILAWLIGLGLTTTERDLLESLRDGASREILDLIHSAARTPLNVPAFEIARTREVEALEWLRLRGVHIWVEGWVHETIREGRPEVLAWMWRHWPDVVSAGWRAIVGRQHVPLPNLRWARRVGLPLPTPEMAAVAEFPFTTSRFRAKERAEQRRLVCAWLSR